MSDHDHDDADDDDNGFKFGWSKRRKVSTRFKRDANPIGRIIIISGHACRPCGYSFHVNKDIFVISTARHGYHTATPPVRKNQEAFQVVNVSKTVAKNVFNAKTVGDVISGMRKSIPSSNEVGPRHAFYKNTRVVVKARANIDRSMEIPDSLLFVTGLEIPSDDEGIFLLDKTTGDLSDISHEYDLVNSPRTVESRSLKHNEAVLNYSIKFYQKKLEELERVKDSIIKGPKRDTTAEQQYNRFKEKFTREIDSLKVLLANRVATGKYIHGTARHDHELIKQAGTPNYVLLQDILNHTYTKAGDVFIIAACSSICGSRSKIPGDNQAHRKQQCLSDPMLRTKSVSVEDNVSKKIISGEGAIHSEGDDEEFENEEQEQEQEDEGEDEDEDRDKNFDNENELQVNKSKSKSKRKRSNIQGGNLNKRKSGSKKKKARTRAVNRKKCNRTKKRGTRNKNKNKNNNTNKRRKNK